MISESVNRDGEAGTELFLRLAEDTDVRFPKNKKA